MIPHDRLGDLTRRQFGALTAGSLLARATLPAAQVPARTTAGSTAATPALDIADWSYYWYGIERVMLARGTLVNGTQMFVEHWIPADVRHPFPVVLIHGSAQRNRPALARFGRRTVY